MSEICAGTGMFYGPEDLTFDAHHVATVPCPKCGKRLTSTRAWRIRKHTLPVSAIPVYEEMATDPDTLLDEARTWLRMRREEGAKCPCCKQLTRVYRRRLNSGMAHALILLYKAAGTDWVHKPTILSGVGAAARDESLLRYWGLLYEATHAERPDGGRAGWWRVTAPGAEFVRGERSVPEYVVVYDGRGLRTEGRMISIQDALGKRFNLNELLGRAF